MKNIHKRCRISNNITLCQIHVIIVTIEIPEIYTHKNPYLNLLLSTPHTQKMKRQKTHKKQQNKQNFWRGGQIDIHSSAFFDPWPIASDVDQSDVHGMECVNFL